jgi:all-trans-retinol 13,14-reductase
MLPRLTTRRAIFLIDYYYCITNFHHLADQAETVTIGDPKNGFLITAGSLERYKKSLVDLFPDEKKAIEKFLVLCEQANKVWPSLVLFKILPYPLTKFLVRTGLYRLFANGYKRFTKMTVAEALEGLTDNKDLRAILASNFGDFGIEPDRAPFLIQATVHQYYWNGSFYPRGGPASLPKKIIHNILAHGGNVFTKASVKQTLLESDGKTIRGVEMEDGSTITAKNVVSDAGLFNTATKLLPKDLIDLDFAKDDSIDGNKLHPVSEGAKSSTGYKLDLSLQ